MSFGSMNYVEYAVGDFKARGRVTTLDRFLNEQILSGTTVYRSYFRFDKDFYTYAFNNRSDAGAASVAGFKGKHITDFVWFDIDDHDPDESVRFPKIFELLDKSLEIITKHVEPQKFVIEFSGWGGFHISLPAGLIGFEPSDDLCVRLSRFTKLFLSPLVDAPGKGVDASIYKVDTLFKLRNSKSEKGELYKTKINLADLEDLRKDPLSLKEYCKSPKQLPKNYLRPEAYWGFEPVPALQEIWERTQVPEKTESDSKRSYSFTGFKPPGMPQCVSNIVSRIVQNQFPANSGRNNAFTILAAYYRNYVPTEDALLSLMRSYNNSLVHSLPDQDVVSIVKQNFKAGGYGTGCMNPDSALCTLSYCNKNNSLYECPEHLKKEKDAPKNRIWMWGDEAFEEMKKDIAKGPTNITFSFDEFSRINKFIKHTDKIIVQGASTTGKSMFSLREMRHMIDIAFQRGEFISLGIPEQGPVDYAKLMTMQQMGLTLEGLYNSNGQLKTAENWYEKYKRSFVIQKAVHMTVGSWRQTIEEAEQKEGKKCMLGFFDGVGFMDTESYAKLAFELADLTVSKNMVLWIVHHLTKTNTKDKKKDVKYEEGGITGGFGSTWFGNAFDYVFSVFYDDDDRTVVAAKKFKQFWQKPKRQFSKSDGGLSYLPELKLYSDGNFGLYTAQEVDKLGLYSSFADEDQELIKDELFQQKNDVIADMI